jgi:hypothetical protein
MNTNTSPATTAPARRRSRPVLRGLVLALVLAVVALGSTACDPTKIADCTKDCIEMVYASNGGDKLTVVANNGGITSEVTLYSNSARTTVVGHARNFDFRQYPTMPITKQYQGLPLENPTPVQLRGATTYYYKVKATGLNGSYRWETGSFKTMKRTVTLTTTRLYMWDDSDVTGAGELTFDMRANSGTSVRVWKGNDLVVGYDKTVNASTTVYPQLPQVTIQVRAFDDDCTFETCTLSANEWSAKGDNGDVEWATGTATISLPNMGATGTWQVEAGAGGGVGDMAFRAYGTYSVTYGYA